MVRPIIVSLLFIGVGGVRVKLDVQDAMNVSADTFLEENDACGEKCGWKGGVCNACGGVVEGSVAHVCCRARSDSPGCSAAKKQNPTYRKDGDRQCITLQEGGWTVFPTNEVETYIKMTPDTYHDNLKGIIWMDQTGFYGYSDISLSNSAPDAAVSFGDDRDGYKMGDDRAGGANKQVVDPFGPGWTWFNHERAYKEIPHLQSYGMHYLFSWNEDFTQADIDIHTNMINPPKWIVDFKMHYQADYNGVGCPPLEKDVWLAEMKTIIDPAQASKKDITEYKKYVSKCAKWVRTSKIPFASPYLYYAFEIVDKDGKLTPYYNKYVEWVNSNSEPNAQKALAGGIIARNIMDPDTSLIGSR